MTADTDTLDQVRRLLEQADILLLVIAALLLWIFLLALYAYGDWRKRRDR